MAQFASLNSRRMQAALYYARKKRRARMQNVTTSGSGQLDFSDPANSAIALLPFGVVLLA